MATFEGNVQEFNHYIGPRIRNRIQYLARKERKARNGVCEDCGKTGQELHSAHLQGRDRRTIIEAVLARYESNGVVCCDIRIAEVEVVAEHGNVRDAFKFLCNGCHLIYDNQNSTKIFTRSTPQSLHNFDGDEVEIAFLPADENGFRSLLIQQKRAYVVIYKSDGTIEPVKEWTASRFTESSSLRNNIFSGHLRNWKQRGIVKAVFSIDPIRPGET
jgi:hypothetical protein